MVSDSIPEYMIRIGKFDEYKGPICLSAQDDRECDFCNDDCRGLTSKIMMDSLSFDKKNVFFEEEETLFQATNINIPNMAVRGQKDRYTIIFKLKKNIGKIRTDLILKIRQDFINSITNSQIDDILAFANDFCNKWESRFKKLKYVTEFEEERLRTEEALRDAEEILSSNSIIIRFDTKGVFTFLNLFAQEFFGFSSEDVLGKKILGTIVPEKDRMGNILAEKIEDLIKNPEEYKTSEIENICKNGSRVNIAWTNKPIYDSAGVFAEILSVGIDITALKETERKLADEKARAQLCFDIAGVMLIVFNPAGKISRINKKGCQTLGYDEKELIQKEFITSIILEKDRDGFKEVIERVVHGKNEYSKNYIVTKKGEKKLIFWHNAAIKDDQGKLMGVISSGEDISEQKEAEKKIAKVRAVKVLKDQMK
jgi:PAS domain S-box-containing protein